MTTTPFPRSAPLRILLIAALLLACAPAVASDATATPTARVAPGVYTYQPAPLIWQLVTIVDGDVANAAGAVFEWSCAGQSWTIGTIPARISDGVLRFGDESFAMNGSQLDARWRRGIDPRGLPRPVCPSASPTTKALLSPDAARELIVQRVTAIAPVLTPAVLPDGVNASVDVSSRSFSVTYGDGNGIRVTLQTVLANPAPIASDGTQRHLTFHGDGRAFYQALDGRARTTRTLLWSEPATDASKAAASSCACTPYALTADGLTSVEFWEIANSIR